MTCWKSHNKQREYRQSDAGSCGTLQPPMGSPIPSGKGKFIQHPRKPSVCLLDQPREVWSNMAKYVSTVPAMRNAGKDVPLGHPSKLGR